MPSRKQRRREQKSKRHQYEFVYVDAEGNELEEPPPELVEVEEQRKKQRTNGAAPAAGGKQQGKQDPQRGARRAPAAPSWERATKRALLLGVVVYFLFTVTSKGSGRYVGALYPAVIYTVLFIPFTYWIDRFAYRRYQARQASGGGTTPRPTKKR